MNKMLFVIRDAKCNRHYIGKRSVVFTIREAQVWKSKRGVEKAIDRLVAEGGWQRERLEIVSEVL